MQELATCLNAQENWIFRIFDMLGVPEKDCVVYANQMKFASIGMTMR